MGAHRSFEGMTNLFTGIIAAGWQTWPFTITKGIVNIASGTTNITSGDHYDCESLTIASGAFLNISASNTTSFTLITAKTLILNGTIKGQLGENTGGANSRLITQTGVTFTYTINQNAGGDGSRGEAGGTGGANAYGNGGGGAGFNTTYFAGLAAELTKGGNSGQGAVGASVYSGNGANGTFSYPMDQGGGGGSRGRHGQNIIIYAKSLSGSGTIITSGGIGGNGGSGFFGETATCGAGGGGAGGSAGGVFVRYKSNTASLTYTTAGGNGGTGGIATYHGVNGTAGTANTPSVLAY